MRKRIPVREGVIITTFLCFALGTQSYSQVQSPSPDVSSSPVQKGVLVTIHASGPFEVKLVPQTPDGIFENATTGRMTIDKQFHGDLEATSKGQMLTAGTVTKGSAVYVAVEKVTGTLRGRGGSFLLHHQGIMTRGVPQLSVAIVPDSGTDALKGISGTLAIRVADGKHSYELDYSFEEGAKA